MSTDQNAVRAGLEGTADRLAPLTSLGALSSMDPSACGWDPEEPLAVYLIDLVRFKAINDLLGYRVGDELLAEFSDRVREWAGAGALVFRIEGDRFAAILTGLVNCDHALTRAQELHEVISGPMNLAGRAVRRSAKIGLAFDSLRVRGLPDLLHHADSALEAARLTPGATVRVFTDELQLRAERRAQLEFHLPDAASRGELRLDYQPEFDLRTGAVVAAEALVRWEHPSLGLLLPDEFIDVAERTNTIGSLGEWVLREACRQIATWREEYVHLSLAVRINISPTELADDHVPDLLVSLLAEFQLEPASLCIEINELVMPPSMDQMVSVLHRLQALGVTTALDDFGTGHNSLAYLKMLPVDFLKIDRDFVGGLGVNPTDTAIVESLAHLARAFNLELIAEGVERAAAIPELLRINCVRAQGHLFAPAMPPDAFGPLLRAGMSPFARLTKTSPLAKVGTDARILLD